MLKYLLLFAVLLPACFLSLSASSGQEGFSRVEIPRLPARLDFAGEAVPLAHYDVREALGRELMTNSYMHSRTMLAILRTHRYFPVIVPILHRYGIPDDFKYLCVAESNLDPNAVSSSGAAGLWQLMRGTASSFGLLVEKEVDERYHVEKATEAACRLLRENYDEFGSWTLAAAAYNLGRSGVRRRIDRQGTDDYYESFFPAETMRYVYRILAFKVLLSDPSAFGFSVGHRDGYKPLGPWKEDTVSDRKIDWSAWAQSRSTTYKLLRELNPWIRDYTYDNKDGRVFTVRLPDGNFRE